MYFYNFLIFLILKSPLKFLQKYFSIFTYIKNKSIKIDPYNSNNHQVKKISGLRNVFYKFENDYIIFKIKNNVDENLKIIEKFLTIYNIEYIKINKNANNWSEIKIKIDSEYNDILKECIIYVEYNYLPDFYYWRKECFRKKNINW
uniref:Uncharacterized protein n=1 Tax=Oxytricha trifallax TaxID=1172189 RepID=G9HRC3_9SPIT|nr:hypothetical protein [Oxytricha trifallax]